MAEDLHVFVESLLENEPIEKTKRIAENLEKQGYHLRITRSLEEAKGYLRERYREDPNARFGMVASARDKDLAAFGIPNGYQDTKQVRYGPWYGDAEDAPGGRSCRQLTQAVTEFGAQGLELDAVLLGWGTDLMLLDGTWDNHKARRYQRQGFVKDSYQLRINAYRVLMTRGRDATIVYLPPLDELDETFRYLTVCGFRELEMPDRLIIPSGIFSRIPDDHDQSCGEIA